MVTGSHASHLYHNGQWRVVMEGSRGQGSDGGQEWRACRAACVSQDLVSRLVVVRGGNASS